MGGIVLPGLFFTHEQERIYRLYPDKNPASGSAVYAGIVPRNSHKAERKRKHLMQC